MPGKLSVVPEVCPQCHTKGTCQMRNASVVCCQCGWQSAGQHVIKRKPLNPSTPIDEFIRQQDIQELKNRLS